MSFSRRPGARFNRGRIATAGAAGGMTPAQLISGMQALNTWRLLCSADIGISEATIAGRASAWADQSGNGRNWATPGASNEPLYTAVDSTLGNRASVSGNGVDRRMTNAYNPSAPLTLPEYRISVQKMNSYISTRTFSQAGTNRYGTRCGVVPGTVDAFNGTVGAAISQGERKWVIQEEYFSGSTNDFLRIGDNQASGTNLGNTDPASIALFASNAAGVHGDYSCGLYAMGTLPADRAALRALIVSYYGSTNIKQAGETVHLMFFPDSQSAQDFSAGFHGYRYGVWNYFDSTLGYFIRTLGNTAFGDWATNDTRHDGVSGSTIAAATTYLVGRYGAGGSIAGAGSVRGVNIFNGGAGDIFAGTPPATMLVNLEAYANAWLTAEPSSYLAICNLVPYPGNPADLATFNSGIPAVIANVKAGANGARMIDVPTTSCIDLNTPMGGTYNNGLVNGILAYQTSSDRHMNEYGSNTICAPVIIAGIGPTVTALAA